jgi:predicted AAA+ superfamily ATPase
MKRGMFERKIIQSLEDWRVSIYRKPLVIRGARQVGKTTVIKQFSQSFTQFIYLNLENNEDKIIFKNRSSIKEIVDALFFIKDKQQNIKDTLIFIDEIQEMPEAISALRYFYEEFPQYYVIAAGSLLETLFDNGVNFPVGRVDYKILYPFSFEEFLMACGETQALAQYHQIPISDFAHDKMMRLFHTYTLIGGMPEVVKRYVEQGDLIVLKPVYESLLLSYIDDVEKYARNNTLTNVMRHCIGTCFVEAGSRIKFNGFGSSLYGSREVGEALRTLEKAKLIYLVYPTTETKLPFLPNIKKSPRLQVLDTGMLNFFAGVQKEVFNSQNLNEVYHGRIIEHVVGQEFIANNKDVLKSLLFWVRDKEGSSSELDFLFQMEGSAIPIEVKSGKSGTLKSLHQYVDMAESSFAIRFYAGSFQIDHLKTHKGTSFTLLNIPYYLSGNIEKYIQKYQ